MSFSFGSQGPAPATSGFNFGGAPAPATNTGFGFGGSTPAPAPTPFSFGSPSPAPASSFSFGSPSTAPAPSTFGGFGAAPAPTSFGGFGTSPAPAPLFGAPATSTFGSPAPAPFGQSSAPAPFGSSFGGGSSLFGAPQPAPTLFGQPTYQQQQQQYQQQPPQLPAISGNMRYDDLPPQYRAAIDQIHNSMMEHKKFLLQVKSSGPAALQPTASATSTAVTTWNNNNRSPPPPPRPTKAETQQNALSDRVLALQKKLDRLRLQIGNSAGQAAYYKTLIEELVQAAYLYCKWPLEAVAVRRGIRFAEEEKKETDDRLREILDLTVINIDRIERMPSPYFWQLLENFERRLQEIHDQLERTNHQLDVQLNRSGLSVVAVVDDQERAIIKTGEALMRLRSAVEDLRQEYSRYERPGENILDKTRLEAMHRQEQLNDQIQRMFISAQPATQSSSTAPAPTGFGAPPSSGFGMPASTGFGAAAPAPFGSSAPAPSSSFSFSTTTPNPAPAPFSFSSPTASAPVSSFASTAPSTSFGVASAPAPVSTGFGFAPAPAAAATNTLKTPAPSTPKKNSKSSRSSSRLNKR